jgi:putative nucleotidyltransferase with HDIG domain
MTALSASNAPPQIPLADMVREIDRLPALPAIVADLLQSMDQEDIDLGTLAGKIALDQTLVACTLRYASASRYGTSGKAATIQQAISLIGLEQVRNLVTTAALSAAFPAADCPGFDFNAFWRHSIATAVCARVLARHLHLHQDFAFTAGLLHDIGRLVLATLFPHHYAQVIVCRAAHDCYPLEAERMVLGLDHIDAGNALADHWRFAPLLQHAINGHHAPEASGSGSVASLVNVADAIAHALDLAGVEDDLVPAVSLAAWHAVGLDGDAYLQIFRTTELEFGQLIDAL